MNIFLGLIGVHEFFFILIFPCTNIFFVLCPPPHKFSNGPSLSHFSFFFCTKIRVYTTQSLQKRENRHLYLCKISMEKKNWKGITVIWSGRNWVKEPLQHKTLHVENSTRPPNHMNSVKQYQAWACTDQTLTESTEQRCSLLVKKCIQLFSLIKCYPNIFLMSF